MVKKKSEERKRKSRADYFAFFKKATGKVFRSLVSDYGFKQVSISEHMPECAIRYWNETTGLTVSYEWKSALWVELSRLEQTPTGTLETERHGLDLLIAECCPDKSVSEQFRSIQWTNEDIERILRAYASLLEEQARDVLLGDFRVFAKLEGLAKREQGRKEEFTRI